MKEETTNTIRVERARHKITQAELAAGVGCSKQTVHNVEVGRHKAELILALKIVRFLNGLKFEASMRLIVVEDIFKLETI